MAGGVKMVVTNGDLNMVFGGLQKLEEMPWVSYQLLFRAGFIMDKLSKQHERFMMERSKLFDKYGVEKPNPDGGENIKELNEEGQEKLAELLSATGDELSGFKVSEFFEAAKKHDGVLAGLTPVVIRSLAPILVDDVGV